MRRLEVQLEGATQALVGALVLAVAFAASHIQPWNVPGARSMRWVALLELGLVAVAFAFVRRRPVLPLGLVAVAALAGLALASAAWSADAELSAGRALSFAFLLAVAATLAAGSGGDARLCAQLLLGVLGAVTFIALAGLFELWHAYDQAVVPATRGQGARYNGIGQNPNQIAMLLALALPLALWAFVEARTRFGKAVAVVLFVLFDASLIASGSRGALVGALAGCATFAFVSLRRRRTVALLALAALFTVNVLVTQLPPRAETEPVLNPTFGQTPKLSERDLNSGLPLESEFGFPGENAPPGRRGLIFSSGRSQAWEGALRQALERPLLGYGFGMEHRAFVDRYYMFVGERVENSYLGTLLQLGPLGLVMLLLAVFAPLVGWLGRRGGLRGDSARVAAAAGGVAAGGIVLAVPQSFVTSVGSPPTAPFWLAVFLLGAMAARSGEREQPQPGEREIDTAQRHPEAGLDVMRREHDGVRDEQRDRRASGAATPHGDD